MPAIGGVGASFAEFVLVEFWLFTDKFETVEFGRLVSGSAVDGGRFEVFMFETEFVLDRSHAKSKRVNAKIAYIAVFLTNFPSFFKNNCVGSNVAQLEDNCGVQTDTRQVSMDSEDGVKAAGKTFTKTNYRPHKNIVNDFFAWLSVHRWQMLFVIGQRRLKGGFCGGNSGGHLH